MKRKLTLFLSAVMVASSVPMAAYAANFKDINAVPWATTVINDVADKGLLSGYEDGTFRGKNNVTYCEAMQMVYTTLTKSNSVAPMDAVTVYGYMQALDTLKVPKWSQMAVAYGLSIGVLDMQMVATKFAGGTKTATREDVAKIFGNAMGYVFGKEKDVSGAASFADYWSISADAVEQVSMLKNMGIIKGDDYNRFSPKNNITRAEMAVMLSNTYGVLENGLNVSGTIVELDKNTGADGTVYYYIAVEKADGHKDGFSATEGKVPVYVGNTTEKTSLSKLSKGDEVVFMVSGNKLVAIRLMEGITAQEKYDVTGYVNSVKDNVLSLDNENTGETAKYTLHSGTTCYVEGEKVKRSDLDDIVKATADKYIYAGLLTDVRREKVNGAYENVTYVEEVHITFVEEYTVVGEVKTLADKYITVKVAESTAQKTMNFADGCKFYVADTTVKLADAKSLMADGTVYAQVRVNAKGDAISVTLAEDEFVDATKESAESKTYKLSTLSDRKMILLDGTEKITYEFGSKNPLENIQFYVWDKDEEEWDKKKDVEAAEEWCDKVEGTVYARITFNNGGKLNEVYVSDERGAWKNSKDHQTDRKGTLASMEDDVLKFKTSSIEYKFLRSYDEGKLKSGSTTAKNLSKTFLSRLVNAEGVEVYAELKANGDNEILELTARVTEAAGELVEFNPGEKFIKIVTEDGTELKLASQKSPTLTDEEEDKFELEDLEGKNSKYVGEWVELGFTTNGIVNKITVESGAKHTDNTVRVKGIAVAANDGLKVEGDKTTYRWKGRTDEIRVSNYSGDTESLATIKKMIEDPDVEVYVEATLDESAKGDMVVDSIKIYVRAAEGTLKKFDGDVRITTDAGNTFTFDAKTKLDTCDVKGYGQEDLKEREKGVGTYVKLTFNKDGDVTGIEG